MKIIRNMLVSFAIFGGALTGTVGLALTHATPVSAATCSGTKSIVMMPAWYDGLCQQGTSVIQSPKSLATTNDPTGIGKFASIIAMNIVTILLYIVGYVALAFIIWGGYKYMISGDNSSGTSAAKTTILNAVIGLVLSMMSIAIVKFIAGAIS